MVTPELLGAQHAELAAGGFEKRNECKKSLMQNLALLFGIQNALNGVKGIGQGLQEAGCRGPDRPGCLLAFIWVNQGLAGTNETPKNVQKE